MGPRGRIRDSYESGLINIHYNEPKTTEQSSVNLRLYISTNLIEFTIFFNLLDIRQGSDEI